MKFKSNIKCGACVAKVTPVLDEVVGSAQWSVDLVDPNRVLSIIREGVQTEVLKTRLSAIGYQIEPV